MKRLLAWCREAFLSGGRVDARLLAAFCIIHLVLVVNFFRHSPWIQFDSTGHVSNIRAYAQGHLPEAERSKEFFSAPLPYLMPALLLRFGDGDMKRALRCGQALNVGLSIMMILYLLRLLRDAGDIRGYSRLGALLLLGMMPVYYRTFAMVRGEAMIAAFALPAFYLATRLFWHGEGGVGRALSLGLLMGLMALSRQWGVFLLLAAAAFAGFCVLKFPARARAMIQNGVIGAAAGLLVCGWFYYGLHARYGSVTAFNQPPRERFALANRPAEFYLGTGRGLLFREPFRGSYDLQFLPVFYSDMWGDYWGYFLIYGRDTVTGDLKHGFYLQRNLMQDPGSKRLETNLYRLRPYMGFANAAAVFPAALLLAGVLAGGWRAMRWVAGRTSTVGSAVATLAFLGVLFSMAGYFWWLLMYRTAEGSTIKATYMMQLFPLSALLGGQLLGHIGLRRARVGRWMLAGLLVCAAALSPLWFSRF